MKVQILPLAPTICAEFLWSSHRSICAGLRGIIQTLVSLDAGAADGPEPQEARAGKLPVELEYREQVRAKCWHT